MNDMPQNPFEDMPVIFQYTRAQAIADGVLIDLTEWAKEVGFRFPVACTDSVWNGYVVPTDRTREIGQSELRRPRTGGFLAGRFYAATAGAFSASYALGER